MARGSKTPKYLVNAAQRARVARSNHSNHQEPPDPTPVIVSDISVDDISDDENELCSWPGGVNNHLQIESELSEENWLDLPVDMEGGCFNTEEEDHDGQSEEEDEDLYEQEDEELRNSLEESIIHEARANFNAYENLTRKIPTSEWAKAEANCSFGYKSYNGNSKRSKRRAQKKDADGKKARTGQVSIMRDLVSCY